MTQAERLLSRLFGVALIAHVVGNWQAPNLPTLIGASGLLVGVLGVLLLVCPGRFIFISGAVATLLSALAEIPILGNHWLLAGFASAVVILTLGRGAALVSGLRWLLVVFYGFAAFAKLNRAFLDPISSCAVFYLDQNLRSWGLPIVSTASPLAHMATWLTVAAELSVVPLLIWKRTRWLGVLVGSVFHGLISLDLGQHFYDFTAVLYFLFAGFIEIDEEAAAGARGPLIVKWLVAPVSLVLVVLAVTPLTSMASTIMPIAPFVLWVPFVASWLVFVLRRRRQAWVDWKLSPAVAVVVVIAFLNGLTPYLELKTAFSFNMYSNLLTAQGETNHLLIPRTFPLRNGYEGPVEIIESSDEGLELYRERGYLIAYPQFQQYLVGRSVAVTYARDGVVSIVSNSAEVEGLATTGPWWWRWMPLRSLDERSPPRCQDVFLPAL